MKAKFVLFTMLIITILAANGCKKNDAPVAPPSSLPATIIDLKVGTQWVYRYTFYDSLGRTTTTRAGTLIVLRDTTIGGEKWYFIGQDSSALELLTNRTDGLYYRRLSTFGNVGQDPCKYASYPATLNQTWVSIGGSFETMSSLDVSVTVPSGAYSCYQYDFRFDQTGHIYESVYFPPGKGFVREDVFFWNSAGLYWLSYRRELVSVILPKIGDRVFITSPHPVHDKFAKWLMPLNEN